eukprot:1339100-Amorphochlora_amoeboformis.AAC.2
MAPHGRGNLYVFQTFIKLFAQNSSSTENGPYPDVSLGASMMGVKADGLPQLWNAVRPVAQALLPFPGPESGKA